MRIDRQTVVIGGGVTGLACAYRLRQLGVSVTLLEASERAGGVIETMRRNGFVFEASTQCPRFPRALWDLVLELGLEKEFVSADPRAKRFVLKEGKLHPAPLSPWGLIKTRLVGIGCKVRFVAEPLANWKPPQEEESLGDFVRRKFGDEALDFLVDPFVASVFFGDPDQMGMDSTLPDVARWERECGSVLRGGIRSRRTNGKPAAAVERSATDNQPAPRVPVTDFLPPLGSFKTGFAALTERLTERLGDSLILRARVESLCSTAAGSEARWRVRLQSGGELTADSIVLAAPAYEAARMLKPVAPHLSDLLEAIPYAPLAVVASGYDRAQVQHSLDGFGFNLPRREGLHTISCTWNSSLFAGRAPAGKVLITSFARPLVNGVFLDKAPDEIARVVEGEVGRVLGISGAPVDREVWKYPQALPQFRVGHARRIVELRKMVRGLPGLHIAGNYFDGRSVGHSAEIAASTAEDVVRFLNMGAAKADEVGRI